MILVHAPLDAPDAALPAVLLRIERRKLARRVWRAFAEDGAEFGFQLERPLRHGQVFHQTANTRYVIEQLPEPVLTVSLVDLPPSAASAVGWAVGNLHLECSTEPGRLLTADEPAARRLFERIQITYTPETAVFRAGRFSRGAATSQPAHELGPSHQH
ncbi:MAG: urease accessory protein UreE [Verrucomicrobiota bacterium]